MVSRRHAWLIGAAAGLVLGSPAPPAAQHADARLERSIADGTQRRGRFESEATDRETRTLKLGANGSLSLNNVSGDVEIRPGRGSDTTVVITRRARGRTAADARRGLEQVTANVDQRGDRATISSTRMQEQDRDRFSVSIDYEITMPAGTAVAVDTLAGDIDVEGIAGDLSLSALAGEITVRDARRISRARTTAGVVRLINVQIDGTLDDGSIAGDIIIERSRVQRLSAQTVSGDVAARDVICDRAELTSTSGDVEFASPLTAGGRYELLSHAGDVRFIPIGDRGFELRATTVVGQVRVGEGLDLTTVSRSRRELRGTFGDASAEVIATSFAGSVLIIRR
jgi:DUF4097 and DUF4098 domain-containing protein YvlB